MIKNIDIIALNNKCKLLNDPVGCSQSLSSVKLFDDESKGGSKVLITAPCKENDVIFNIVAPLTQEKSKYTMQLASYGHIDQHFDYELWRFANHSCTPSMNVQMFVNPNNNIGRIVFVANRDLEEGEELSFDYLTTERDMVEKFQCSCGVGGCRGVINGYDFTAGGKVVDVLVDEELVEGFDY
eukprot:TRINITY_DN5536_c1_g2_i1.p1 TRINITY_DN5536_c1_g2~~TRINITY_DN5536_c1_g2_i1.p1  ORF type:complete len:183 (-),score=19.52 TRINITY_DN5536_c1_g2_i1:70-618(-)